MALLCRPPIAVPAGSNRGKRDRSETRWQNAGPVWTRYYCGWPRLRMWEPGAELANLEKLLENFLFQQLLEVY